MMGADARLDRIYSSAKRFKIGEETKIVLMSDVHRGDGGHADTFSKNQVIYFAALSQYERDGFTYIELGDGDELWEFRTAEDIVAAHEDVFGLLSQLHRQGRLVMIYGNHDMVKRSRDFVQRNYKYFIDSRTKKRTALFDGMQMYEAVVLENNNHDILLLHGHQVDPLNSTFWRVARFLVRYLWRPLESLGVNDPTSAAKNRRKKETTLRKLLSWAADKNVMMIAGHTHRPVFPDPGQPRYFNDGSAVQPRCVTAIEIAGGTIALVKWEVKTRPDGTMYVGKELLDGPEIIDHYFS